MSELQRLQKILANSQAVLFYWRAEPNWPVEFVSDNLRLYGYEPSDFLQGRLSYADIIYPDDLNRIQEEVSFNTANGIDEYRQEYRILDARGQVRWIDDRTLIERNKSGEPTYYLGTIIDITEQRHSQNLSRALGQVVDQSADEIYLFNPDTFALTYLNQLALFNTGWQSSELVNKTVYDLNQSGELGVLGSEIVKFAKASQTSEHTVIESTFKRHNGALYPVLISIQKVVYGDEGEQVVAIVRDKTDELVLSNQSAMIIRPDYSVEFMDNVEYDSNRYADVADKSSPKCYEVSHHRSSPCSGTDHPCPLKEVLATGETVSVVHNHGDKTGDRFIEIEAKPLTDASGAILAVLEVEHDITELVQEKESLRKEAVSLARKVNKDVLTGLPNRDLFEDKVNEIIRQSRHSLQPFALVFLDIDYFKQVNDTFGHQAGDQVLKSFVNIVTVVLRKTDALARFGGDEFVLLLEGVEESVDIEEIFQKIQFQLQRASLSESTGSLTCSAGVARFPQDGTRFERLIECADQALYQAKEQGRDQIAFYE